jgi:hypothetical protein
MCNFFGLNFAGPSYSTIKLENQKGVQFVAGEHRELFKSVAKIYKHAMLHHEVQGPIPVILAKDEMKVKSQIS